MEIWMATQSKSRISLKTSKTFQWARSRTNQTTETERRGEQRRSKGMKEAGRIFCKIIKTIVKWANSLYSPIVTRITPKKWKTIPKQFRIQKKFISKDQKQWEKTILFLMRSNSKHTRRVKHDKQREPWNISASSILLITTRSITHINNNNNIKRGVCFLYRQFLYSYHKHVLVRARASFCLSRYWVNLKALSLGRNDMISVCFVWAQIVCFDGSNLSTKSDRTRNPSSI